MKRRIPLVGLLILILVGAIVVVACGDEEAATTTAAPPTTAAPTTTAAAASTETTAASLETTAAVTKNETLKIGLISSSSGDYAAAFKTMYDSVGPTTELLNEMGGVTVGDTHYDIEIVFYDDQSTTAGGLTAINKLIGDGVKYVVPPMVMPVNMAIAQTCEENKIMRVKSFGAGQDEVNPDNPYMFFTCSGVGSIRPFYDYALAKYPDVKKVAVITPEVAGATTYEDMVKAEYEARGIEIVYWEVYPAPLFDFYSILNKALGTNPDAIECIFGIVPDTSAIVNQSRELGYTGPIFGPCTLGDSETLSAIIPPENGYDVLSYAPLCASDKMTDNVKRLGEKLAEAGASFQLDSILLFDACSAIIAAIDTAQSIDTEKVVAAIDSGACKGFEGSFGPAVWGSYQSVYGNNHCAEHAPMVTIFTKEGPQFEWLPWDGTPNDL